MPRKIRKYSRNARERFGDQHRFEHWYVDNQVYFITARCRDKFPAFAAEEAKAIFWDKFQQYTDEFHFEPWVVSLLDNHYHALGYLKIGLNLKIMMQRLHGSIAKLINDTLPERFSQFFRDRKGKEYFDGCIRDELQFTRAFRYTYTQCRRHGICADPSDYPHTRLYIPMDQALARAIELDAFMPDVSYPRYF